MLIVTPMIWIQNQLVGAQEGQQMTLECHSEAFPKSINYWTRENNVIIANGTFRKYYETLFIVRYSVCSVILNDCNCSITIVKLWVTE